MMRYARVLSGVAVLATAASACVDRSPTEQGEPPFAVEFTSSAAVQQGESTMAVVSVTRRPGFTAPIELIVQSAPSGVTGYFDVEILTSERATATLRLDATPLAQSGTGPVIIQAVASDGVAGSVARTAELPLEVQPAVHVAVTALAVHLTTGGNAELGATVSSAADASVTWTTSAADVATVSADGVVHGRAPGTAVITARSVEDPRRAARVLATVTTGAGAWAFVSVGSGHICAITRAATAYCAGDDSAAQLGTGEPPPLPGLTRAYATPQRVTGAHDFVIVEAGVGHTCALTTVGELYCWGRNSQGQLGTGSRDYAQSSPRAVAGGARFGRIAAGQQVTCGTPLSGRIFCWGDAWRAAVAPPAVPWVLAPEPFADEPALVSVRLTDAHACGLTVTGEAWCWGSNGARLGSGDIVQDGSVPVRVPGGPWSAVAAGGGHSCAVSSGDSSVHCWGTSPPGVAWIDVPLTASPAPVAGGLAARDVAAGRDFTCALDLSGAAWCWGVNDVGQLGNDTNEPAAAPVRVAGELRFIDMDAAHNTACAVATDGRLYCWGLTPSGPRTVPTEIPWPG